MCVICKQARRTGKSWAGMGAGGEAANQALWIPQANGGKHQVSKGPLLRFSKQAFVRATPQLPGGPLQSHVSDNAQLSGHPMASPTLASPANERTA